MDLFLGWCSAGWEPGGEKRRWLYHSVLLVRGDGQELGRVRDRRVLQRLRGRLEGADRLEKQREQRERGQRL